MNPFRHFVDEGKRLTDIYGADDVTPRTDEAFPEFYQNGKRLEFLRDLIARVDILAYCYDTISGRLKDHWDDLEARIDALPVKADSGWPNLRIIPADLDRDRSRWLLELDALTSLIYYEATSVVGLLRQLGITLPPGSEIKYLVKVRDRFLAHVQLSGASRSGDRDYGLRDGFFERDVVALSSWSSDDLRCLGAGALDIGSKEWHAQRRANEELILSDKRNHKFTLEEKRALINAGVRECSLREALDELAALLEGQALPVIADATNRAIDKFGFIRPNEDGSL